MSSKSTKQYLAAFGGSLGALVLGVVIGWSSASEQKVVNILKIKSNEYGWISSVIWLGAGLSQILTGVLMETLGRKWTIITLSLCSNICYLIIMSCWKFPAFIAARFIAGLFVGGMWVVGPTFIGEITHKSVRGAFSVMFQMCLVSGILYCNCLIYIKSFFLFNFCCTLPSLVVLIFLIYPPDTPLMFLLRGKEEAAKKSLFYYRGEDIEGEFEEFKLLAEKGPKVKLKDLLKERACRKAFLILLGLMAIQQFTGASTIISYMHLVLREAKAEGSRLQPREEAIIISTLQVVSAVAASFLVDKLGRKKLYYISLSLMAFCTLTLALYIKYQSKIKSQLLRFTPLGTIVLFLISSALGNGPLPATLTGELVPTRFKSVIGTFVCFMKCMFAFLVVLIFPLLAPFIGIDNFFLVYTFNSILAICFIRFYLIETKNKSLEEIQLILNGETVNEK